MKRLALAISVLAVSATGALANPVYNWTGFHLGGKVGYSWGRFASTLWLTDAGTTASSADTRNDHAVQRRGSSGPQRHQPLGGRVVRNNGPEGPAMALSPCWRGAHNSRALVSLG